MFAAVTDPVYDQLQSTLGSAYTVARELGGGGMSRVFVAHEHALNRDVVVKLLSPELAAGVSSERFAREIQLVAALQEPHIVPVLSAGVTADGLPFYTMPFIRGETLRTRLDAGPVPHAEATGILRNVVQALAHAHGHHIVHRDIKPENVLLSSGTAVVTDFGIAKALTAAKGGARPGGTGSSSFDTLTQLGTSLGTPKYMAPEQAAGDDVDPRADLYSWGVMAYELLAGRHPFAGKTSAQQLMAAHVSEIPVPLNVAGSPRFAQLVMRCLEKDPARRPQSAAQLLAELDDANTAGGPRAPGVPLRATVGIVIVAVVVAAAWWLRGSAPTPIGAATGSPTRIAVIPLRNAARDTADEYFTDGISDALIQELSKIPRLSVVSRRSASEFRSKAATPQEVGKALGVSSFVEGSVQRNGGRLRVNAQLVKATDGAVLWSDKYDRAAGDVFALQDDITRAIAAALRVTLGGGAPQPATANTPARAQAYDLYLLGKHQAARFTEAGLRAALDTYGRALAIDSTYAASWEGLGSAWFFLADDWVRPHDAYPRGEAAVQRALSLDSTFAAAYTTRAWIRAAYDYDLAAAIRDAEHALSFNPSSADALEILGLSLSFSGRSDSAIAIFHRARALDPLGAQLAADEARVLMFAGRYDEAIVAGRAALAIDPQQSLAHFLIGQSLLGQGHPTEALTEFARATATRDRSLAGMAVAHAVLGRAGDARAILDTMLVESKQRYVRPEFLAWVYLALGQQERTLSLLERAYADKAGGMIYVPVDPRWLPLRGNARFEALAREIRGAR
jgi:TolB-like protein/Flp pilus assembly protein TadD